MTKLLEFETKVTGIKFFLVDNIREFIAKEKGIYVFKTSKSEEAKIARSKEFKYICTNISFYQKLNRIMNIKTDKPSITLNIIKECPANEDLIEDIITSFRESHYFKSNITKKYATKIYKEWLYNNLFRGRTINFFVMHRGNLIGLICFLEREKSIIIDILWIREKFRNKKIGRYIILEGIKHLNVKGKEEIIVETQCSNIPAVNLYLPLFEIKDTKFIFHYLKE